MLECLILGDSIAVGIGQMRPDCVVEAKSGINSLDYLNSLTSKFQIQDAKTTVISLGSNDAYVDSYEAMVAIRKKIKNNVIWVMSTNNVESRYAVLLISKEYGDKVLDTSSYPLSKDRVHPTGNGYKLIAESF